MPKKGKYKRIVTVEATDGEIFLWRMEIRDNPGEIGVQTEFQPSLWVHPGANMYLIIMVFASMYDHFSKDNAFKTVLCDKMRELARRQLEEQPEI